MAVTGAVVVVPLEIYNDLVKMRGRVDALCDYVRGSGDISTVSMLRILDREYLIPGIEKKNRELWEKYNKEITNGVIED